MLQKALTLSTKPGVLSISTKANSFRKQRALAREDREEIRSLSLSRSGQVWYVDFAIALLLFTFTVAAYLSYTNNFQKEERGDLNSVLADSK